MTIQANIAISYTNKFYVKVKNGSIEGRGIKKVSCSILDTNKYLVTESAYNSLCKKYSIEFKNVYA